MSNYNSKEIKSDGWNGGGTVNKFRIIKVIDKTLQIENDAGAKAVISFSTDDFKKIGEAVKKVEKRHG